MIPRTDLAAPVWRVVATRHPPISLFELVAGGLSPMAVGVLSDSLKGHPHALMTAAVTLSFAGLVICGAILWRSAKAYAPLVEAIEAIDAVAA